MTNDSSPKPTAVELHAQWKRGFFECLEKAYLPNFYSRRRKGLSSEDHRRLNMLKEFRDKLANLCQEFEFGMNEIKGDKMYRPVKVNGFIEYPIGVVFERIEHEITTYGRRHGSHTDGTGRVVPAFLAKNILVGLALHRGDKDGQDLMHQFLSKGSVKAKESSFHQWCKSYFEKFEIDHPIRSGLLEIADAVCADRGYKKWGITQWSKGTQKYFLDQVENEGKRKAGKRDRVRRQMIMTEIRKKAQCCRELVKSSL